MLIDAHTVTPVEIGGCALCRDDAVELAHMSLQHVTEDVVELLRIHHRGVPKYFLGDDIQMRSE